MRGLIFSAVVGVCVASQSGFAEGFVPEGQDYPRYDPGFTNEGLGRDVFDRVIDRLIQTYQPLIEAQNVKFEVVRDWTNDDINAKAEKAETSQGMVWRIYAFGGLARRSEVTEDAFTIVMCHELGHLIGGKPYKTGRKYPVAVEGQSDYWGVAACFPVIRNDVASIEGTDSAANYPVPQRIFDECTSTFADTKAQSTCKRANQGGLRLATLLARLGNQTLPNFDTPDKTEVAVTNQSHPIAQCRLDTMYAAAMGKSRPRCWFKPDPADSLLTSGLL